MAIGPGTRLGPYEIRAPLGAGGMGEVYRARDTRLGRDVALKILPESSMSTPEARSRLEREARAVAGINHPHVCTLHDVGREGYTSYLVFELVEGETLRDRLTAGPLPIDELLTLGIDIADALVAAHAKDIVHRDLKPENVMVTSRGAKVMDFGLATGLRIDGGPAASRDATATDPISGLTGPGSTVGTVAYMSPEQARGQPVDARSDLFSLGSVLYEMATGMRPFPGPTTAVVFDGILNRDPPPPRRPEVPPELERIILKALEKDRDFRYQTASELRADLKRLKRDLDSSKFAAAAQLSPGSARSSRIPAIRWWIALGTLSVTAALVWALVSRTSQTHPERWTARRLPLSRETAESAVCPISPDGTKVAYLSDSTSALSILSLDTNDTRIVDRLTSDDGGYVNVDWNADGSKLVATRCDPAGNVSAVLVDLITGHRDVLARLGRLGRGQAEDLKISLSPTGAALAVRRDYRPSDVGFGELHVVDVRTGAERYLVRVGSNESIGPPIWAPTGNRLAYGLFRGDREYSRIETCNLRGIRTTVIEDSTGGLEPFSYDYPTMRWGEDHQLVFAARWGVLRGHGDAQLWSIPVDPATGNSSTRPAFLYSLEGAAIRSPSISKDSRRIIFAAGRQVRAMRFIGTDGRARYAELSSGPQLAGLEFPIWSRDGRGVFVRSDLIPPDGAIGRIQLGDGRFETLTRVVTPRDRPLCLTPDGRELLCVLGPRLVAFPVAGGAPRIVADHFSGIVCCAARSGRCVSIEHIASDLEVRDLDLKTGKGAVHFRYAVEGMDARISPTADLSPDGSRLVVLRGDSSGYAILDATSGRELGRFDLPAGSYPQSVRWSADGKTLFASGLEGIARFWIEHLEEHGVARAIWKSDNVWPGSLDLSPDGSTLACTSLDFGSELWLIQRQQ